MEIFEVAHLQNPENGHEIKLYLTKEETMTLLQHSLNDLVVKGVLSFTTERDGINIADLATDPEAKAN